MGSVKLDVGSYRGTYEQLVRLEHDVKTYWDQRQQALPSRDQQNITDLNPGVNDGWIMSNRKTAGETDSLHQTAQALLMQIQALKAAMYQSYTDYIAADQTASAALGSAGNN